MKHLFTMILSPDFLDKNDEFIGWMEELLTPDSHRLRIIERQVAMLNAESQEDMGAVDAPVLIMAGAKDRVLPLHHAEALQRSLLESRLLVLEGAAHHPFLEAPQEAIDGLIAFLEAKEE